MKFRRAKIVLIGFIAFLVTLVVLADSGHGGRMFRLAGLIPMGDKVGHLLLFGALSFLINLVQRAGVLRLGAIRLLRGSAIILPFVVLEELSQVFFRTRSFDLLDLSADLVGIWIGGRLAVAYLRFKSGPAQATGQNDAPAPPAG